MAEDNWRNSEQERPFPWLEGVVVSLLNQSHTDEYVDKILLSFFLQSIHHCCYIKQLLQPSLQTKLSSFQKQRVLF